MALIKCPECGKKISDRAKECPRCGISMEEIQARLQGNKTGKGSKGESENNARTHKEEKKHTPPKGKKWLYYVIPAAIILIIAGIVFLPRLLSGIQGTEVTNQESTLPEEPENVIPTITGNGVEPFIIGASLYDIAPSGVYYDTILLEKYFRAFVGDGFVDVGEDELSSLYDILPPDEIEESVIFFGKGFVLKDNDTIIAFEYKKDGTIKKLQIATHCLKLKNGIHVGMTVNELIDKYNAKVEIEETNYTYERILVFKVENVHPNIKLLSKYIYSEFELRDENGDYHIPSQIKNKESLGSILISVKENEWDYYYPLIPQKVLGYKDDEIIRGEPHNAFLQD